MIAFSASSSPFFVAGLFLLLIAFALSSPAVRSEYDSSVIRLPTGTHASDAKPCPGSAAPASCPVKCFRPDPVCGVDGVTYWCGCADALCSGIKVAKLGFCEVGNGGSGPLSGQALLLLHIVWLILLGFLVLFGFF
ncbi:uncharacterized protein LOC131146606 [Malania oleifera]|uniref:uncharacterized protein LOC131146606 n=1 Tax=Malania oleifera TaxID=397392 RepID=UPI0025AE91E5|nr:uncharacterized protein LOC131146606 [Malania oleifera]